MLYYVGQGDAYFLGVPNRDLTKPETDQLAEIFDMTPDAFSDMLRESGLYAGRKPDTPGVSIEERQEAEWAENMRLGGVQVEEQAEKPVAESAPKVAESTAARAASTATAVKGG